METPTIWFVSECGNFQKRLKRLKEALAGLHGMECIADDILVWGSGSTTAEAEADHSENLKNLLDRARLKGLKFNKGKCEFNMKEIEFQGHVITENGLQADPKKVKAIIDIPHPANTSEVKVFRGMVNYLSRFLPDLTSGNLENIATKITWTKS